jgi:hypothetical protein
MFPLRSPPDMMADIFDELIVLVINKVVKLSRRGGSLSTYIRNYGNVIFHHRGHREHREKYKNQSSVNSVLSVV